MGTSRARQRACTLPVGSGEPLRVLSKGVTGQRRKDWNGNKKQEEAVKHEGTGRKGRQREATDTKGIMETESTWLGGSRQEETTEVPGA